jgi:large subunit ribosomal protein L25
VEIPLHFIGESKAEKELGGTLNKSAEAVKVKCLPGELVESIEVDISNLNTYEDMIHFGDLKLAKSMELLNNPEDVVAHVMELVEEKIEEPVVAEVKPEEVPAAGEKVENEGKKDNKKESKKDK